MIAYYAGGCFWGVEHLMQKFDGVESVVSGYMGGDLKNPTYKDVCSGNSGHLEVVKVTYNPIKICFTSLTKLFFEIHDPTQKDGQGSDIGEQYHSVIFYEDRVEKMSAEDIIFSLQDMGMDIATKLLPVTTFWSAEEYHQNYYIKNKKEPYCHIYKKLF